MASTRRRTTADDTQDDDDDIDERIATAVNAAVGDHIKRKLPKMLKDAIDGPLGELRTLIEQRATPAGDEPDDAEEPEEQPAQRRGKGRQQQQQQQPAQPAGRRREDPELVSMRKKVDAMEAERKLEREQARARDRDTQLREHLTKLGVEPNRMRGAIAVLRESTRLDDKTGTWSYIAKRDGYDEELDLDTGAQDWAATDEGKAYLAPPQPTRGGAGAAGVQIRQPVRNGGSGARPGAGARLGATSPTGQQQQRAGAKTEAVQNLAGAVDALLGGAVQIG